MAALSTIREVAPPASDEDALKVARIALLKLELTDQCFTPVVDDADDSADNRANDQVFRIVRVEGRTSALLAHSSICGLIALLEEAWDTGANLAPLNG